MADDNIHELFKKSDAPGLGAIDTARVIRRSKARRLPAQLAAGGALVLALGGLGVFAVQAIVNPPATVTDAGVELLRDGSFTSEEADAGAVSGAPSATVEVRCATPVGHTAPHPSGLELSVNFADAAAGSSLVDGTVTLTNAGTERVTGTTAAAPEITLSQNGIVTWHSNGPMIMVAVQLDLAPGESLDYTASFAPVVCGPEDETGDGFRENLNAAPAGDYELSASLTVLTADGGSILVAGPAATITLK